MKPHQCSLLWCHNGRDSVSNHQPHDCLLNRLFRRRSKKTPKLRVIGLCAGNSSVTSEFPAQMAINADNVSIWRRHHIIIALRRTRHYFVTYITLNDMGQSAIIQSWHHEAWWRHQIEIFYALLALPAGNHPSQWSVTQSFAVFFDLSLHKGLGKNRLGDADDLRRQRTHHYVAVMVFIMCTVLGVSWKHEMWGYDVHRWKMPLAPLKCTSNTYNPIDSRHLRNTPMMQTDTCTFRETSSGVGYLSR